MAAFDRAFSIHKNNNCKLIEMPNNRYYANLGAIRLFASVAVECKSKAKKKIDKYVHTDSIHKLIISRPIRTRCEKVIIYLVTAVY